MASATPSIGGMILLEPSNRILNETIRDILLGFQEESKGEKKPSIADVRLCDFDGAEYRVVRDRERANILQVYMSLPCYEELKEIAAAAALEKLYPGCVAEPGAQYNVALNIDMSTVSNIDELAERVALLKTHVIGSVFDRYFTELQSGASSLAPFKFNLRSDTTVFFFPGADRVTVVFGLDFSERSDRVIARVFLQEFTECRRSLGAAPPCQFNHNPPLELKHFNITEPISEDHLGFVSFALLKNHVDAAKKERVVGILQSFRNYLQYHIKCSKAYFHSRMRARVISLLKVINRAKQDPEATQMKTMHGKTFTRK